jgi:hypothetical protein
MNRLLALVMTVGLELGGTASFAQVAGRLSGNVLDPSGAAVSNAAVSIYLPGGKEPVLAGNTNEAGLFLFVAVRPDTYDLAITAPGFSTTIYRQVKVSPLQEMVLPAIELELQAATQTVDITASVSTVRSSNAEVTTTITNTMIQNLPVLNRQLTTFYPTQPGVNSGTATTAVNGLKSTFSNVTLDGINIQDNAVRNNGLDYPPFRTTIDQIAEITISTSNQTAAVGGGASQFTLSTKSGSNSYHGAVYWFNRNNAIAASDWFNNRSGLSKPKLDLNQPGVALGGHIVSDKLFFYANYEWYRNKQERNVVRTVLTDSARSGIFTYVDTAGVKSSVNLQTLRNYAPDPTIKAMIAQLPEPNAPGGDGGLNTSGYLFNASANESRNQFVYKGDYYITPKHSITGTYDYTSNPIYRPDAGAFFTVTPPVSNAIRNHLVSLGFRSALSAAFTNEVRAGFARTHTSFENRDAYPTFRVSGLFFSNPVNTFFAQGRETNTYPIQDNANWIRAKHQIGFGFQFQGINVVPFDDTGILPTYTLGISVANTTGLNNADLPGIRFGDLTQANNLYANLAGLISSATQTFNVTSTTSGFVPGANNLRHFNYSTYAAYAQDNWRLRLNLTINLGLRYEYWVPLDEHSGLYLAPVLKNNNLQQNLLDPNAALNFIGGPSGRPFYHADKNNFGPNIGFAWDPFKKGTTSIRGGYMMAFVNDNLFSAMRNILGLNNGLQFANTQANLVAFLSSPPMIPAPAYKVPRTLADNYAISTFNVTGLPDPKLVTPVVHEWNFSIQREMRGVLFAARYVGNKGADLLRGIDYNQVLYDANGFLADFLRAQNNGNLAVAATGTYNPSYNPGLPGSQPLTVFPLLSGGGLLMNPTIQSLIRNGQVGGLADTYMTNRLNGSVNFYRNPNLQGADAIVNGSTSTFHSLQIETTTRTRAGLQAQFSYVYGKSLSNTSGDSQFNFEPLLDNNNPSIEWARTPYDIKHAFKANYYYELPFGPGKKWTGASVVSKIVGGWALSGIWAYFSGSPYSILTGANGFGWGTLNRDFRSTFTNTASVAGTTWPQLEALTSGVFKTGSNIYFLSPSLLNSRGQGASQPGAAPFAGQLFFNPGAGTVGNLQRRMFSGPWQWSWDASVKKAIRFTERHTLDLRFDFFNFMNHPTFYIPPATAGDFGSAVNYEINSTTFGQITGMNFSPRVIQVAAYYRF